MLFLLHALCVLTMHSCCSGAGLQPVLALEPVLLAHVYCVTVDGLEPANKLSEESLYACRDALMA